jgi:hypothetical protein
MPKRMQGVCGSGSGVSVCVWNEEEILTPTSLTNSIAEVDYIVGRDEKKSKFILIKNHT